MLQYEQTRLWKRTLAKSDTQDPYADKRQELAGAFSNFRQKAVCLAGEIHRSMPGFTVHDSTHIDALWTYADMLVPKEMPLNPAEGFVLGGAFLLHDLGMGLVSYQNGLEELKSKPIWRDTAAALYKKAHNTQEAPPDFDHLEEEIRKKATETAIRQLHAEQAYCLAGMSWKDTKGQDTYLMDNQELREAYSETIGLIAYSHWWSIDDIQSKFTGPLGALSRFPTDWTVDPLKLACILRAADAMHIDDRRAPGFLMSLRAPKEESKLHWLFQNKLYQPMVEDNRLLYTSKSPFDPEEMEAWWVCYDTLKGIDRELWNVDSLLAGSGRVRLNAMGVACLGDLRHLAEKIATKGWQPVDTKVRVSNVGRLVSTIGGRQMYGEDYIVPLRELIQNATDAIRARRVLDGEPETYGDVLVTLGGDGDYIEVEDNGVGMSERVLLGPFLDFGNSFWGSELMHQELPGLEASGFASTGQYGIGFYSVFMWGSRVQITTRRYDAAREDTLVLEFCSGAGARPILRKARREEWLRQGGTRVRVWLAECSIYDVIKEDEDGDLFSSVSEKLGRLCPSLDANLFVAQGGKKEQVLAANDWITIPPMELMRRIRGTWMLNRLSSQKLEKFKKLSSNLRLIYKNDQVIGRIFLSSEFGISGRVTIGGITSDHLMGIGGILAGSSERASRDSATPIADLEQMQAWAQEQLSLLKQDLFKGDDIYKIAEILCCLGSSTGDLKIAKCKETFVSQNTLLDIIEKGETTFILTDQMDIDTIIKYVPNVKLLSNLIIIYKSHYYPFGIKNGWPYRSLEEKWNHSLKNRIYEIFCEAWNCTMEELKESSLFDDTSKDSKAVIGSADGKPVTDSVLAILNKPGSPAAASKNDGKETA